MELHSCPLYHYPHYHPMMTELSKMVLPAVTVVGFVLALFLMRVLVKRLVDWIRFLLHLVRL